MNIDFSILMALIAFSAFVAVLGFWMQRKDEQTIIPALSLFVSASLFFFLFASIDTVSNAYFSSGNTDDLYHYNVMSSTTTSLVLHGATNYAGTIYVSSSSSELIGDTIDCIDVQLRKSGSPTGLVQIGVFTDEPTGTDFKIIFGSFDASLLTTSNVFYTSCLAGDNTYTIINQDRIGVFFSGGDAGNFIAVSNDANNPFDGIITYRQQNSGAGWSSTTSTDLTARLYLTGGDFEITGNTIDMSELKYYFLVIATFLMLTAVYSVKLYKGQGSGEYIDSL